MAESKAITVFYERFAREHTPLRERRDLFRIRPPVARDPRQLPALGVTPPLQRGLFPD